jgi:predicted nucleic acid-binding protein
VTAFVDTNVLVRHLTGDPPDMAARATDYLSAATDVYLTDLVLGEVVYVLGSFYRAPRRQVAESMRALLALDSVTCRDPAMLLRSIEVYEVDRLDYAEAYLVACAEGSEVDTIVSFDRTIDRVGSVVRIEPGAPH